MPHIIKIQHASNCIPFSKYCKISILANGISMQVYNITLSEILCHKGGFLVGLLKYEKYLLGISKIENLFMQLVLLHVLHIVKA